MSRVESPFHAIAAEALDDNDTPDVPVPRDVEANGSPAPAAATAAATNVATSSVDAKDGQEENSSVNPPALESNTENGGESVNVREDGENENGGEENGGNETSGKKGGPEEEAAEETLMLLEQKASSEVGGAEVSEIVFKKSKKRTNVWTRTTSRKSAKKIKNSGLRSQSDAKDENVLLKPFHQEDDPSYPILLSKTYKAEKIELSVDRLTASGSKGYRMVRATRGVVEGAWYFEIYVERLGDTGHTRLGWSTRRGDLQAPVGYDAHSYSYRDLDGCKVHAALREDYGEAYHEKDVIGFYINLPREPGFTRKPEEEVVSYKGQPYTIVADEPLRPLPGSEILFFKNGACEGVAFKDINEGSYFPAASMYTLPSQDSCNVVFNFGPEFRYPVTDLGDRPPPSPMCQASGPSGEAKAEAVPSNQTAVVEFKENDGDKWMISEHHGKAMEVEEATEATRRENTPKEIEKMPPVAKKKVKKPKFPVGNQIPPPLSKNSRVGGILHPQSRKDEYLQSFKNDAARMEVEPTGLLSQKGSKKDTAETGLLSPEGTQKSEGLPDLKGVPKVKGLVIPKVIQKGKGLSNLKEGRDKGLPSLQVSKKVLSGTGTPSSEGFKQDMPVLRMSSVKGTGLPNWNNFKKDLLVMGSQNFEGSKENSSVAGLQSRKWSRRDASGSGLSKPKKIKRDLTGTESARPTNEDLTGTGLALKATKKDVIAMTSTLKAGKKDSYGTGSALKASNKDSPGTGSVHKSSKNLHGTGLAHKRDKKGLPVTGSVHKPSKNNGPGRGSVRKPSNFRGSIPPPRPLGPAAFCGGRSWGDGIRGAMNVDVFVVETSAGTQDEGHFR